MNYDHGEPGSQLEGLDSPAFDAEARQIVDRIRPSLVQWLQRATESGRAFEMKFSVRVSEDRSNITLKAVVEEESEV